MDVVRIVLDVALALLLAATGAGKLAGAGSSLAIRDSLHVPPGRWRLIGALELVGVVGLVVGVWIPVAGVAAAVGVVALMAGAIVVRTRAGEAVASAGVVADSGILLLAVVAAVLGLRAV